MLDAFVEAAVAAEDPAIPPSERNAGAALADGDTVLLRMRRVELGARMPWLHRLVGELERRGVGGRFEKPRPPLTGQVGRIEQLEETSRLVVFLAGRDLAPERLLAPLWRLMSSAACHAQVFAGQHIFVQPVDDRFPATLLDLADTVSSVILLDANRDGIADLSFGSSLRCAFSVSEAVLPGVEQLAAFRAVIEDLADELDVAWIARRRNGSAYTSVYDPAVRPPADPPAVEIYAIRRPSWSRWVPDAQGLQLLGPDHLAAAHDLTRWRTKSLPGGRALVEAPDLGAWYGAAPPSEAILAEARADFGDLIVQDYLSLPRD
ncbi:hypothetical protein [Nocardioides daeguensis]|uniref:Uncharacterized protein n=1 Tax=Nocardioides daeguensis TaxID=908359 RepID=A0ABP6V1W8_9ACTN|nr:hypothetical protein [Nocardioides daeguensis]MBV6729719.1 hypothetical protein [Nocardioides daeguensis]MCR1774676.1 hypothetical protein [Nocardioides daeguensis]